MATLSKRIDAIEKVTGVDDEITVIVFVDVDAQTGERQEVERFTILDPGDPRYFHQYYNPETGQWQNDLYPWYEHLTGS